MSGWGVSGLTVKYGRRVALDEVTVDVPAGAVTAVIGGDGAGKTTLLRALAGVARPTGGTVRRPARRRIGYVAGASGLYDDLSVAENVAFVAGAYGVAGPEARATPRRDPRAHGAGRHRRAPGGAPLRRDAPEARLRPRHAAPTGLAHPRRTHDRGRPREPRRALAAHRRRRRRRRRGGRLDHLPRRGAASGVRAAAGRRPGARRRTAGGGRRGAAPGRRTTHDGERGRDDDGRRDCRARPGLRPRRRVPLRPDRRGRRRRPRRAPRRGRRPARRQRRRQDDLDPPAARPPAPDLGRGPALRPYALARRPPAPRLRPADPRALGRPERGGEPGLLGARLRQRAGAPGRRPRGGARHAGARPALRHAPPPGLRRGAGPRARAARPRRAHLGRRPGRASAALGVDPRRGRGRRRRPRHHASPRRGGLLRSPRRHGRGARRRARHARRHRRRAYGRRRRGAALGGGLRGSRRRRRPRGPRRPHAPRTGRRRRPRARRARRGPAHRIAPHRARHLRRDVRGARPRRRGTTRHQHHATSPIGRNQQ